MPYFCAKINNEGKRKSMPPQTATKKSGRQKLTHSLMIERSTCLSTQKLDNDEKQLSSSQKEKSLLFQKFPLVQTVYDDEFFYKAVSQTLWPMGNEGESKKKRAPFFLVKEKTAYFILCYHETGKQKCRHLSSMKKCKGGG